MMGVFKFGFKQERRVKQRFLHEFLLIASHKLSFSKNVTQVVNTYILFF